MVRRTRRFAIAAVAVLALVLVVSSVPVAQAQNTEPPLGDCWGGVFPEDPLHCYALEQAEREKLIDVTALYVAPGGGPLYVWLNQTGPVSDEVNAFLKTKSQEFYARWPNLAPHLWVEAPEMSHVLPPRAGYEDIVLHIGGEAARRQQRGGASWRQIWAHLHRPQRRPLGRRVRCFRGQHDGLSRGRLPVRGPQSRLRVVEGISQSRHRRGSQQL